MFENWTIDKVALWAAIIGGVGSILWLIYTVWQHKRTQEAFMKQDALTYNLSKIVDLTDNINYRIRNVELSQCANPYVYGNAQLSQLLQCPVNPSLQPGAAQQQQGGPPIQTTQMPIRGAMATLGSMAPPLPNYGFFGTGPAGLASSGGGAQMPAFANDIQGGPQIPVAFR